jgi:hypothetical protein
LIRLVSVNGLTSPRQDVAKPSQAAFVVHCGLDLFDFGYEFGLIAQAVGAYSVDG